MDQMNERIVRLKSVEECDSFAQNALALGRADLANQAHRRVVALRAEAYGATTQLERECLEAVFAYEEVVAVKAHHRASASTTWRMIKKHGVLRAIEGAVIRGVEVAHHAALLEMGLLDHAFEAVVVHHPEFFTEQTVQRSRRRVEEWMRI